MRRERHGPERRMVTLAPLYAMSRFLPHTVAAGGGVFVAGGRLEAGPYRPGWSGIGWVWHR